MEFKSRISGNQTRGPQFITEIVMLRQAKKQGEVLREGFWNDRFWKKAYQQQLIAANALLKIFEARDVVAALDSKEGSWIFSLRYKGLADIIHSKKTVREKQEKKLEQVKPLEVVKDTVSVPAPMPKKKTLGSKLRELDG